MARGALMVVPPAPPAGSAKPCCVAGTPPMATTPGTEGEPVAAAAAPAAPAATPGLAPPRSCSASCCSCMAVAGVEAVSSRKASLISCGRAISRERVCESACVCESLCWCWCLVVCERRERDAARAKERSNNHDLDLSTRRDTASTAKTKTKTQLLSIYPSTSARYDPPTPTPTPLDQPIPRLLSDAPVSMCALSLLSVEKSGRHVAAASRGASPLSLARRLGVAAVVVVHRLEPACLPAGPLPIHSVTWHTNDTLLPSSLVARYSPFAPWCDIRKRLRVFACVRACEMTPPLRSARKKWTTLMLDCKQWSSLGTVLLIVLLLTLGVSCFFAFQYFTLSSQCGTISLSCDRPIDR